MELPFRRSFYPLGFEIEILTNHHSLLDAAEESFGHSDLRHGGTGLQIRIGITKDDTAECPPEPLRREYDHLYLLAADRGNQALLDLRTGANFTWLNECARRNRIYVRHNFLEKVVYLLLGASVVTDLHAGCVSRNDKGVLLCGDSGVGKSTLSYGCARAGWTYTSDDTCYLINANKLPRVVGHSHRVRFRPAAAELFPELKNREITPRMEGKASIEVPVCELPPITSSPEADVSAIVYLRRSSGAKCTLHQLPHGSASALLCEELYSAGSIRAQHQRMLEKVAGVPTYELHYCALEDAIQALEWLTR
jgi:hypothetical protein